MNVLVLASRPQEAMLGCGGTMARLAREGHAVYLALLGGGASGEEGNGHLFEPLDDVPEDACQAVHDLGTRAVFRYGLPVGHFDRVPLIGLVQLIHGLVDQVRPEVVYTPRGVAPEPDATVLYRATLTAVSPPREGSVRRVYAFETPVAGRRAAWQFAPGFEPNVYVDISDTLDHKVAALERCRPPAAAVLPGPALRAAARHWQATSGLPAAEAFLLVREVA